MAMIAHVRSDMGYGSLLVLHQADPFVAFQAIDSLATEYIGLEMERGRSRALKDFPCSRHDAFMSCATVPRIWCAFGSFLTGLERSAMNPDYWRTAWCRLLLLTMYSNDSVQWLPQVKTVESSLIKFHLGVWCICNNDVVHLHDFLDVIIGHLAKIFMLEDTSTSVIRL